MIELVIGISGFGDLYTKYQSFIYLNITSTYMKLLYLITQIVGILCIYRECVYSQRFLLSVAYTSMEISQ